MTISSKVVRAVVAPVFMKQAAIRAEKQSKRQEMLRSTFTRIGEAIFVSTNMRLLYKDERFVHEEVVYENGIRYIRLTPEYWAWMRHAYNNAERACRAGKLNPVIFEELLNRIAAIYNIAIDQYGEPALKDAEQSFSLRNWQRYCDALAHPPPVECEPEITPGTPAYRYPADGIGASSHVSSASVAKVDAVRDRALHAGWTLSQLYQNVGIAHRDWGFVCYVGSNDEIGEITRQSIEIIDQRTGKSLRFYNNDVEQSWITMEES